MVKDTYSLTLQTSFGTRGFDLGETRPKEFLDDSKSVYISISGRRDNQLALLDGWP